MGEHNWLCRGDHIAVVSLLADGSGNGADDRARRDGRRVGSWSIGSEKGGGIAWPSGTFGQVLALPSCGGSDRGISPLAIGRNSGREKDLANPSVRASA
jgi:hypothetical protein